MNFKYFFFFFFLFSFSLYAEDILRNSDEIKKMHESASSYSTTNNYVHSWIPFPQISGLDIQTGEPLNISPVLGTVSVVFFLASWCIPCQDIMYRLKEIEDFYFDKNFQFYYIFSHDSKSEVLSFSKNFSLKGKIILSDFDVLKNFHNPPLPTVYLSDKKGWLLKRIEKIDEKKDLKNLKILMNSLDVF